MLKAVIVDDEELAIERLSELILETGEIEILKSFLEPEEAFDFIKYNKIDVAFLDISLTGIDGIMLADMIINTDSNIDVVFATGYDEYAVKAFELNAIDYLMKPVMKTRLKKTVEKLVKNRKLKPVNIETKLISLGGFYIYLNDELQNIKWRTSKAEELLAFLVHHEGKCVSRDYIIEQLWKYIEPMKAMDNLNASTYYLRKALNSIGINDCIKSNKSDIWIDIQKLNCDLYTFEKVIKDNTKVEASNISELEKAIGLYEGEYLKNKDYIWAEEKRSILSKEYIKILIRVSEYYFKEGMESTAIDLLKRAINIEPLQEEIYEKLIGMYLLLHKRMEAEKQYKLLEKLLDEELGIEPSMKIKKLMNYE